MQLEITFKNLRPRNEIRVRADALYEKLERFLDAPAEGHLVVTVEHGKAVLELVVTSHGETHTVTEEEDELRTALDKLFHTMEVRLRRAKEKRIGRSRQPRETEDGFVVDPQPQ